MNSPIEFDTERLRLRQWRPSDRGPFAALNADARVMEYFPRTLDREASEAAVDPLHADDVWPGWGPLADEQVAAAGAEHRLFGPRQLAVRLGIGGGVVGTAGVADEGAFAEGAGDHRRALDGGFPKLGGGIGSIPDTATATAGRPRTTPP